MQVSVETKGKLERRVTVVVPVENLNEAYDKRLADVASKANIAGYRQGKAPLNVVKLRYGDSVRQEALGDIIKSSLYRALDQEKLSPVGVPVVEPKALVPNQPLEFVAIFEVMPEMNGFHFNLATLEKQVATITDQDIERVVERLRSQHTVWKKTDRAAQNGDRVIIDFRGSRDGVPFAGGDAHDYPIILGEKTMIPGFEEGIVGMVAGEEKTIHVTFPEQYFSADLAGKAAEFALKAISVSAPEQPALDETFIKKLGVKSGTLPDLHIEIRKNLERELERIVNAKLKTQVFDVLLQQNPLELPRALIEREANRIHDEVHPNHGGHAHSHTDAEMQQFQDAAKRNVALGLLVGEIVKKHNIVTDRNRVEARFSQMAASYENPAEVLEWYKKNKRLQADMEMQTLEDQVVEVLLKEVAVTEKMLGYNELIAN